MGTFLAYVTHDTQRNQQELPGRATRVTEQVESLIMPDSPSHPRERLGVRHPNRGADSAEETRWNQKPGPS